MIKALVTYYLIGTLLFATLKMLSFEWQKKFYYVWNIGHEIFIYAILIDMCYKIDKHYARSALSIAIFKSLIEIASLVFGFNPNNILFVNLIFLAIIALMIYIFYKDFIKKKR